MDQICFNSLFKVAILRTDTQGGGERIVHGRDGRIRDKDTIPPDNDPHPPKDTEH